MDENQGSKHPGNLFGTKIIPCSDDDLQYSEFDDENVFLYIEQDTSKAIYDGALKRLFLSNGTGIKYKIGLLNVGSDNRQLIHESDKITIKYLMEYDELNGDALISFQQAIHYDSTYQKKFQNVYYQLIRKQDNKHQVSIRYQDYGANFYLDIF